MEHFSYINEEFFTSKVTPAQTDLLLADGWRHFGEHFFRYNLGIYLNEIRAVIPLRVRLRDFSFSKSQRRVLRKNQDLLTLIRPVNITAEVLSLFDRHKQRFSHGVPESIYDFLSSDPANLPCEALEVSVYRGDQLLAASFFDVGEDSISSVYGIFDPLESDRSLGILTMLMEINFALERDKSFYYHGYAYSGSSFYDYKKRFRALESFDWRGSWSDFREPEFSLRV